MLNQFGYPRTMRTGFPTYYEFCDEVCQQMLHNPLHNLRLVESICRTFERLNPDLPHSDLHLINALRKVVDDDYPELSVQELSGNLCLVRQGVNPADLNNTQPAAPPIWVFSCVVILVVLGMAIVSEFL